ncbi:MAG: hypothetical protein NZ957_02485, partial [Thaumarchaeota archaeon]|nr:hypothetical protein [Candidatus Calditenuaceae archaeon]
PSYRPPDRIVESVTRTPTPPPTPPPPAPGASNLKITVSVAPPSPEVGDDVIIRGFVTLENWTQPNRRVDINYTDASATVYTDETGWYLLTTRFVRPGRKTVVARTNGASASIEVEVRPRGAPPPPPPPSRPAAPPPERVRDMVQGASPDNRISNATTGSGTRVSQTVEGKDPLSQLVNAVTSTMEKVAQAVGSTLEKAQQANPQAGKLTEEEIKKIYEELWRIQVQVEEEYIQKLYQIRNATGALRDSPDWELYARIVEAAICHDGPDGTYCGLINGGVYGIGVARESYWGGFKPGFTITCGAPAEARGLGQLVTAIYNNVMTIASQIKALPGRYTADAGQIIKENFLDKGIRPTAEDMRKAVWEAIDRGYLGESYARLKEMYEKLERLFNAFMSTVYVLSEADIEHVKQTLGLRKVPVGYGQYEWAYAYTIQEICGVLRGRGPARRVTPPGQQPKSAAGTAANLADSRDPRIAELHKKKNELMRMIPELENRIRERLKELERWRYLRAIWNDVENQIRRLEELRAMQLLWNSDYRNILHAVNTRYEFALDMLQTKKEALQREVAKLQSDIANLRAEIARLRGGG